MSASATLTRIVHVRVKEGNTGLFYAESSDLKGLLVAAQDMSTLWERVPGAIKDLYEATGTSVVVTQASDEDPHTYPFAAIPTEILPHLAALAQQVPSHL